MYDATHLYSYTVPQRNYSNLKIKAVEKLNGPSKLYGPMKGFKSYFRGTL